MISQPEDLDNVSEPKFKWDTLICEPPRRETDALQGDSMYLTKNIKIKIYQKIEQCVTVLCKMQSDQLFNKTSLSDTICKVCAGSVYLGRSKMSFAPTEPGLYETSSGAQETSESAASV